MIPISKPYITGTDIKYLNKVIKTKIFTDGFFQKECEKKIRKLIKSKFISLTHSCTSALEISTILIGLKPNDEVLMPSYGFVSIANAVVLRGAKPIFVDIDKKTLNISLKDLKKKITKKTKALYIIHYAGNSCDMHELIKLKKKYKFFLIEDAAHSFLGKYKNKYLGTIGDIGVFSFHETKNFVSGQGGCISINNNKFIERTNYLLDKGTDRKNFIKNYKKKIISAKNVKKYYSWVDLGSESRNPELSSALLFSQLKKYKFIQKTREIVWKKYNSLFKKISSDKAYIIKPEKFCQSAYHLMVVIFNKKNDANNFKLFMQKKNIAATFHYVPLHNSKMGKKFKNKSLKNTENIYQKVVRLPLYSGMENKDFIKVESSIKKFFNNLDS